MSIKMRTLVNFARLIVLVSCAFFVCVEADCPPGFLRGLTEADCYKIVPIGYFFKDGESECREYGGHLASIGSAFVNAFLKGFLSSVLYFWLDELSIRCIRHVQWRRNDLDWRRADLDKDRMVLDGWREF